MKVIKVNQSALTSCPINKKICYYQKLNPIKIEDDFIYDLTSYNHKDYIASYKKYSVLSRQSVLKAFYKIELEYLKYLLNDLIEQYNIITFYAYRFNTNAIYPSLIYPFSKSDLYLDDIKQNERCSFDPNVSYILNPKLVIDDIFTDIKYIRKFERIQEEFLYDNINGDIMRFNTFFILAYIELSNNDNTLLIFPFDNLNNILQRLKINDSFISNSKDFITEINFYTNNSFIKMYQFDYKNNKDLYIIEHFNERD